MPTLPIAAAATLPALSARVAHVHGDHDPRLREIDALVSDAIAHGTLASALPKIRSLCDDYTPPDWACNSYRRLLSELSALDTGL